MFTPVFNSIVLHFNSLPELADWGVRTSLIKQVGLIEESSKSVQVTTGQTGQDMVKGGVKEFLSC